MNLTFFIITIFLMISNLVWIIFFTPMVPDQEWAQKIFYLHVPIAWSGFLAYFIVMVSGICYLYTKNLKYDRIGLASAEIGTIFTALVLITGPIWATPIWGQPWVWEPRLITTLVLFLIYGWIQYNYFLININDERFNSFVVSSILSSFFMSFFMSFMPYLMLYSKQTKEVIDRIIKSDKAKKITYYIISIATNYYVASTLIEIYTKIR